jgi:regulator of replication initiation timing
MAIFTKGIIGAGIAGAVTLGALVTWDGGSTIDLAKTKITEQAQQIGVFKTNETNLVNKVTSLKTEKAILKLEVDNLKVELAAEKAKNTTDNERILQLEAEIADKNAQITDLESEIATLNTDLENAAGNTSETVERINALEAELNKANAQAAQLKTTLDNTATVTSDQAAVDAALDGSEPVVDDGGDTGGGDTGETKLAGATDIGMLSDVPFFMVQGVTLDTVDGNVIITNASDFVYTAVVNGQTFNVDMDGVTIGTVSELANKNLSVTKAGGTPLNFWLINQ